MITSEALATLSIDALQSAVQLMAPYDRVKACLILASKLYRSDPSQASSYALRGLSTARSIGDHLLIARCFCMRAEISRQAERYADAIDMLRLAQDRLNLHNTSSAGEFSCSKNSGKNILPERSHRIRTGPVHKCRHRSEGGEEIIGEPRRRS